MMTEVITQCGPLVGKVEKMEVEEERGRIYRLTYLGIGVNGWWCEMGVSERVREK
jgi:hypothetical protein